MKVAIITDTNSGITPPQAKAYGIFSLPMPVIVDSKTYFEGQNLTETQFYEMLAEGKDASTSQPAPGDVMKLWDELLSSGYDQIVHIPMSSGLSNSCQTAKMLAEDYTGKVFVVDNHRISVTLRNSVYAAKRMADSGMSGAEIQARLEKDAYMATIYISVNTLEYLKKGGRVTRAGAMLGSALGIKPVLTIQGEKLDAFAKMRSMDRCRQKMIAAVQNDLHVRFPEIREKQLSIGATGTMLPPDQQKSWTDQLREAFPEARVYYDPLSLSIGCHIGPGSVAVGVSFE